MSSPIFTKQPGASHLPIHLFIHGRFFLGWYSQKIKENFDHDTKLSWHPEKIICVMVKSRYIGDGHPTFNSNPCNGYINPYYWVDDHPLLYGNNGSLDPSTYDLGSFPLRRKQSVLHLDPNCRLEEDPEFCHVKSPKKKRFLDTQKLCMGKL